MEDITQEKLKELLHYNPDTGIFTYRLKAGKCQRGDIAGTPISVQDIYKYVLMVSAIKHTD